MQCYYPCWYKHVSPETFCSYYVFILSQTPNIHKLNWLVLGVSHWHKIKKKKSLCPFTCLRSIKFILAKYCTVNCAHLPFQNCDLEVTQNYYLQMMVCCRYSRPRSLYKPGTSLLQQHNIVRHIMLVWGIIKHQWQQQVLDTNIYVGWHGNKRG